MNKLFITLLSLLTILVFLYFSGIVSFYTAAKTNVNFNGASSLIAFDSSGNLKTVPVSNVNAGVDASIKGTANSLSTYITNNANKFANFNSNVLPNLANKQYVLSSVQQGTQNLPTFESLKSYVKKGQKYKIYNNHDNQILLKWGKNIESDGNINSTENYRYFNIRD